MTPTICLIPVITSSVILWYSKPDDVWFSQGFCLKWLQVYFGQESVQHFSEVGSRQSNYRLPRGEVKKGVGEVGCWSGTSKRMRAKAWETVPSIDYTSCLLKCCSDVCSWGLLTHMSAKVWQKPDIAHSSCMCVLLCVIPLRHEVHSTLLQVLWVCSA